jgi:glycosyltransferase involved in cell wall biosynthesis
MSSPAPKVSVLIPTYNYGRFLPLTIESILKQDFEDFELIISDDSSTDDSTQILAAYAQRDPRIRIHRHEPNLGMVANWNWCLQQARGEYIKYLFGDDMLAHPSALSRLVAMLDAHPRASLAASARLTIDENSQVTGLWDDIRREGLHGGPSMIASCLRNSINLPGEPSVVLFRRSQALRGYDLHMRQIVDLEMWFHLLLQGDLIYTGEPLCCFRIHGLQQTAVNRQNHTGDLEMARLLEVYLPELSQNVTPPLGRWACARIRYRAALQLRKKKRCDTVFASKLESIQSKIPAFIRACCWIDHRLRRPFENFSRSTRKRYRKCRLSQGIPIQRTFMKGLALGYRPPAG